MRKGLDRKATLSHNTVHQPPKADILCCDVVNGAIAQLGEHLLCKQGVVGSIPSGSTNSQQRLCLENKPSVPAAEGCFFVLPDPNIEDAEKKSSTDGVDEGS